MDSIKSKSAVQATGLRPEKPQAESGSGILLRGTVWDPEEPLAFVNDRIVGLNSIISGFEVIEIKEDSVTLRDSKGRDTLIYLYRQNE